MAALTLRQQQEEILQTLSDPNRIFEWMLPLRRALMDILYAQWEWDEETGLPVFTDPDHPYRRYVQPSFIKKCSEKHQGRQFINGMIGDEQEFRVNIEMNPQPDVMDKRRRIILGQILTSDFKKIRITNGVGGCYFMVTKTELFTEHPDGFIEGPLRSTLVHDCTQYKSTNDLITEINANARVGFLGPGTFSCRDSSCTVSSHLMTGNRVVRWGPPPPARPASRRVPDRVFYPLKRFKCSSNNLTYLLHCQECINEGRWSTYVGESEKSETSSARNRNFHNRISNHLISFSNRRLYGLHTRAGPEFLLQTLPNILDTHNPVPDDNQVLRDPFSHFCHFFHSPENRRYTVLDNNYQTPGQRQLHEKNVMGQFGFCKYDKITHTGALNHDY